MAKDSTWRMLTVIIVILVGALSGLAVSQPLIPMTVLGSVVALLVFNRHPRLSLLAWLLGLAFMPYWLGLYFIGFIPAASVIAVAVLLLNIFNGQWWLSRGDIPIIVLIVVGSVAVAFGDSNQGVWLSMMTQWLLAYLVGKNIVSAAGIEFSFKIVASILGVVGLLAVMELAFSWHPFVNVATWSPAYSTWGPVQVRGGLDRSEWAMGHSIALGGVLSAAVPFILRSTLGAGRKVLLLLAVFGGIACTFSRAAIVSAVLTLALCLIFMRGIKPVLRLALVLLTGALGFVGIRFLTPIFELASEETAGSSSYRERMLAELVPQLSFAGRSGAAVESADGTVRYGTFHSIDSTFLSIGLGFGWVAALTMLLPFIVMAARLLQRTASTAEIVLMGQLPMLFTVALITQYQLFLWFFAGVAVAEIRKHGGAENSARAKSTRLPLLATRL